MRMTNESFRSSQQSVFEPVGDSRRSRYVCAPSGAAGIGQLTDHGLKLHGWESEDYQTTFNTGRGPELLAFRSYLLQNLGLPVPSKPVGPPFKVLFSTFSSSTKGRVKGFGKQIELLKKNFTGAELSIKSQRMTRLTLKEQGRMTSEAAVFVTTTGGGAVTCTFLPPGATLILFYEATGGLSNNKLTGQPARLDWDLLNHASHLRVHWLPVETLDDHNDLDFFAQLVRNELDIINHRETYRLAERLSSRTKTTS